MVCFVSTAVGEKVMKDIRPGVPFEPTYIYRLLTLIKSSLSEKVSCAASLQNNVSMCVFFVCFFNGHTCLEHAVLKGMLLMSFFRSEIRQLV